MQREQEDARRAVSAKLTEDYYSNVYKRSGQSLKKHFCEMNTAGQKQMLAYWLTEAGVHTAATGQTYTDAWNEPGLVQGIACVPRQHAPTIVEGGTRLPFAQTMWKEEDSGVTPHP